MKNSNFVTPRTLSECYFDPRGSAIEVPYKSHYSLFDWILNLFKH